MRKLPLIYWLPVLIYYGFITFLSGTAPKMDGAQWTIPNLDKIYHFIEYTFFGYILARDVFWTRIYHEKRKTWYTAFLAFLIILVFLDEYHQSFTPQRHMDFWDAVTDVIAAHFGAGMLTVLMGNARTASQEQLKVLRERDLKQFAVILVATLFFIITTVNALDLKRDAIANVPAAGPFLSYVEWACLGYTGYRAIHLLNNRQPLSAIGRLLVALLFVLLAAVYVGVHAFILIWGFGLKEHAQFAGFFSCGVLIKYAKIRFDDLHTHMVRDPSYQRERWQRIYYFYLPTMMLALIFSLAVLAPGDLVLLSPLHRAKAAVMDFFLFFAFGAMFFRGVLWEAWWHGREARLTVLLPACLVLLMVLFVNALLKGGIGQRPVSVVGALSEGAALALAYLVYDVGHRVALVGNKFGRSHVKARASQDDLCCGGTNAVKDGKKPS